MTDSSSQSSSSNNNHEIVKKVQINNWTEHNEEIFFEWADKAMCYRWLHSRSFNIYSARAARYTIPVIIMSTITGTANFAQDKFPEDYKVLAQMTIGAINIISEYHFYKQYLKQHSFQIVSGMQKQKQIVVC